MITVRAIVPSERQLPTWIEHDRYWEGWTFPTLSEAAAWLEAIVDPDVAHWEIRGTAIVLADATYVANPHFQENPA